MNSRSSRRRGRGRASRCASGSGPVPSRVRKGQTLVHWGVATMALQGESESGDLHMVKMVKDGVLIAVVDGLGHGEEAAAAARIAVGALERYAEEPPLSLLQQCHVALKGTRGVVMSVARFDVRSEERR